MDNMRNKLFMEIFNSNPNEERSRFQSKSPIFQQPSTVEDPPESSPNNKPSDKYSSRTIKNFQTNTKNMPQQSVEKNIKFDQIFSKLTSQNCSVVKSEYSLGGSL